METGNGNGIPDKFLPNERVKSLVTSRTGKYVRTESNGNVIIKFDKPWDTTQEVDPRNLISLDDDLLTQLQKSVDKARLDNPKTRKLMREAFEAGWTCGVSDLERSFDEWFAEYRER